MLLPIYQERGKTYQANNCAPLVQAVARGQYPGKRLAPLALSGVRTVGFWDAHCSQDWGLDWHQNEGIELTFLERGGPAYAVDNHRCRLRRK